MSEDDGAGDDWFESALEDDEETTGTDESTASTGTETDTDTGASGDADSGDESDPTAAAGGFGDGAGAQSQSGDSAFGSTGIEGDDPFGGGGGGAVDEESAFDDALFDEEFGEAMGAASGSGDFEDEELESDIPRLDLGIEGLDNMIQGGVPERHLIVVVGGPGTGKTTFGLQFLRHGLARDDPDRGVFITLEQTYDDIMDTADERGWEFDRHEREGNLAVVDLDPVEMANSLDNIRGELPGLIEDFDADRFVLDSVSLLEMMYDDVSRRRTEVFDFTQSLKDAGVTTVLTSEANEDNPYASRHGIIEYLTDAVFLLRYVRSETQETRLAVEIQKIRNANHSRETKPYEITNEGISVYRQANIF
jgi:KaiC domain protein